MDIGHQLSELDAAAARKTSLSHLLAQRGMRALSRKFNNALRPANVSFVQFCLLALLQRSEPPTVKELATEMEIDVPNVQAQVTLLKRAYLVMSTATSPSSPRQRLQLTNKGKLVLADALPLWFAAHEETSQVVCDVDLVPFSSLHGRMMKIGLEIENDAL